MLPHIRKQAVFAVASLVLLISAAFLPARAQGTQQVVQPTPVSPVPVYARTVTVSGAGSADVTPDIAYVTLGVTTDAKTAREALTQNNTQMQSLMTALASAGIASADIKTQGLQVFPRYNNNPNPPTTTQGETTNELVGFTASNTVEVTVRQINNLGQILDQAVTAGSNQIQGIRFDVKDPSQVMDQARQAAMQDAAHKAQQLATLSNAKLGVVITINEESNRPIPFQASGGVAASMAQAVPVSPGTQTVTVNLTVTWELQ